MPELSIVIPVHNGAATLAAQLRAVLASMTSSMELVIVDNRSTDDSMRVVAEVVGSTPNVRVVRAFDRAGEPHARNVGVRAAAGESIAFCDCDDVVGQSWAAAMRHALTRAEYVTGPVDLDRLNPQWLAEVRGRRIFEAMPTTVQGIPFAHGCNIGVRRAAVERAGWFDEDVRIGADVDFAIRAHRAGVRLQWEPRAVVHYRHRADGRSRRRQAYAYGRAAEQFHIAAGESWPVHRRAWDQRRRVAWLIRGLPRLPRRAFRARWLFTAALVCGEVRGS